MKDILQKEVLIDQLKNWFLENKRSFPWRENPSPYSVWISEMMLQQTRASVVIPYFNRWMERFPTIHTLAAATEDEVLKAWEGLGYYSRARYLHEGARYIVMQHNGIFPRSEIDLANIKGLGDYTIGAIRAFAYHERAVVLDGNVIRVLSRYFFIEEDTRKAKTKEKIRNLAWQLLPKNNPWIISEALIELGATLCGKIPQCEKCPLQKGCQAYAAKATGRVPVKSSPVPITSLYRAVAVVFSDNHLLVCRGEKGKVMSDLCEFPYFDTTSDGMALEDVMRHIKRIIKQEVRYEMSLPTIKHSFTRYRVHLFPMVFRTYSVAVCKPFQWLSLTQLELLPFSSGHRRIFRAITSLTLA